MIALLPLLLAAAAPAPGGHGHQAHVTVRIAVSETGQAEKCDVVESDAAEALRDKVCEIFLAKAKFKPAVDKDGQPQKSVVTQTVTFAVQD